MTWLELHRQRTLWEGHKKLATKCQLSLEDALGLADALRRVTGQRRLDVWCGMRFAVNETQAPGVVVFL